MKTFLCTLTVILVSTNIVFSQKTDDEQAIVQAAKDYFEGWYDASPERMNKAMHPDLAKRHIAFNEDSKTDIVHNATKSQMVEYTRAGYQKDFPKDSIDLKIEIYDIKNNIASAIVSSIHFYDYIHVVKSNGKWKIINVLWTNNE